MRSTGKRALTVKELQLAVNPNPSFRAVHLSDFRERLERTSDFGILIIQHDSEKKGNITKQITKREKTKIISSPHWIPLKSTLDLACL